MNRSVNKFLEKADEILPTWISMPLLIVGGFVAITAFLSVWCYNADTFIMGSIFMVLYALGSK